jgi:hypothetical protein
VDLLTTIRLFNLFCIYTNQYYTLFVYCNHNYPLFYGESTEYMYYLNARYSHRNKCVHRNTRKSLLSLDATRLWEVLCIFIASCTSLSRCRDATHPVGIVFTFCRGVCRCHISGSQSPPMVSGAITGYSKRNWISTTRSSTSQRLALSAWFSSAQCARLPFV